MAFDLGTRLVGNRAPVRRPESSTDAVPVTPPTPQPTPAQRLIDQVAPLHQAQPLQQAQQQQVTQQPAQRSALVATGSPDQAASYWVRRRRAESAEQPSG